jgi:hypothetical protein
VHAPNGIRELVERGDPDLEEVADAAVSPGEKLPRVHALHILTEDQDAGSRHFGAEAKEIEDARAKKEAKEHEAAAAAGSGEPKAFHMTCSEPEREREKVEQLYQAFLQAKLQAGEHTGKLSRSSFNEFVLKKTKELQKQKNCKDVEYVVETVAGQVKLKALVKS